MKRKSGGASNARQASPANSDMLTKSAKKNPWVTTGQEQLKKSSTCILLLVMVLLSLFIIILAIKYSLLNPRPTTTCIPSVTNGSNCSCQCNATNTTNITGDSMPDDTLNCSNCHFMCKRQEKQISNLRSIISQFWVDMEQIKNDLSLEQTKHNQTSIMFKRQVNDLQSSISQYQIDLEQLKNDFSLEETKHNACVLKLNELERLNQSLHTLIAQYQSNVDRFNESATKCNDQYTKLRSKYREERDNHNKELVRNNDELTGEKLKLIKMTADYSKCLRDVETCNDEVEECKLKLKENDNKFDKLKENELHFIKDCKFNLNKCKEQADLLMKDYKECMDKNGSAARLDSTTSSLVFILGSLVIVFFSV